MERGEGELRLALFGTRDGLLLPLLPLAPGARALLRIRAECSVPTGIDAYVRAPGGGFVLKNHVAAALDRRTSEAVLLLPDVGPAFEVLLRQQAAGEVLHVHALEVREGPAGGD